LSQFQSLPAKTLDEMSMRLTEGVWLTSMNIAKGKINLSGVGFSTTDIVTYVQGLKDSGLLKDVVLKETNASRVGNVDTFNFSITMALSV
jgi:Tfp pilus assembly protein PilN